jgi:hypothetical protein
LILRVKTKLGQDFGKFPPSFWTQAKKKKIKFFLIWGLAMLLRLLLNSWLILLTQLPEYLGVQVKLPSSTAKDSGFGLVLWLCCQVFATFDYSLFLSSWFHLKLNCKEIKEKNWGK